MQESCAILILLLEKLCKGRLHAQDLVGIARSKVVVVMVVVVVVVVVVSIPHMYVT